MHVIVLTGSQIISNAQGKMFSKALAEITNYSKYKTRLHAAQEKKPKKQHIHSQSTCLHTHCTSILSALLSIKQTQRRVKIFFGTSLQMEL